MKNLSTMNGVQLIAAERTRQIEDEKWTPAHDDQHTDGQLALAAAVYADFGASQNWGAVPEENKEAYMDLARPLNWPWDAASLKLDQNQIRNLVKAGALIAAEIDRLQRAQAKGGVK